jgi:hypothetical protein
MKKEQKFPLNIFKKENSEHGMTDYVAQLVLDDTIKSIKIGNGRKVKEGVREFLVLLKGPDGDSMIQYVMENYLGFPNGLPDKRILNKGKSINISAEELKKLIIEKFEKASGNH